MRRKRKTLHRMERTENRCMKRVRSRIFKPSERFWRNEFYSNIRFFKSVWMYLSNQISTNSRYNWNRYALKHWRRKNNAWNIFAIRFKLLGIESTASVCNFLSLLYYHSIWRAKGRDIQNLIAFFYFPALCYAELYYYPYFCAKILAVMIISQKTIEKLRALINEETEYRSGPKLVAFFNKYGFADLYEPGFPSRWIYTESKLKELNGKPELDKCIKLEFNL